ncbi:MAG: hypothetical protein JW723_07315 [Bacteroidales bacterium]|nr:hypothetical protein [Bacteroidales bacterium]
MFYTIDYDTIGNSPALCTDALQNAIYFCPASGGGRVIVQGVIHISIFEDNNLYLKGTYYFTGQQII